MKLKGLIIVFILVFAISSAWATDENVTGSTTPVTLTAAKYLTFQHGICVIEAAPIRFTQDGLTTPTAGGVGIPIAIGQWVNFSLADHIKNFTAVSDNGSSFKLSCAYW